MAEPMYYLTEADKILITQMAAWWKTFQPNQGRSRVLEDDPAAPETCIFLTPSTGIPARSGTTPGYADCIAHTIRDRDTDTPTLDSIYVTRRLFNLSSTAVTGDIYIKSSREKFGAWLADWEGEAGTGTDGDTILRVCHPTDSLLMTVIHPDGTTECIEVDPCVGTGSGGGCNTLFYCTADGPVEVEVGSTPPTGYTSGPYLTLAEALVACPYPPVVVDGCATEYPTTITMTFTGFSGPCSTFNGSVDLNWNGTSWTGDYAAPAGTLTPTVVPLPGGGGSVLFTDTYSSAFYTMTSGSGTGACGAYPAGGLRTLSGGCAGSGTVTISA